MIKRTWVISFLIVILIFLAMFGAKSFGRNGQDSRKENITSSEKIDEILKDQKDIITRLDDIKKQLDIIKIRASKR